jgi:hypothetical protein
MPVSVAIPITISITPAANCQVRDSRNQRVAKTMVNGRPSLSFRMRRARTCFETRAWSWTSTNGEDLQKLAPLVRPGSATARWLTERGQRFDECRARS